MKKKSESNNLRLDHSTLSIKDNVATITFIDIDGSFNWGTSRAEHRLNPILISELNQLLDMCENSPNWESLIITARGEK